MEPPTNVHRNVRGVSPVYVHRLSRGMPRAWQTAKCLSGREVTHRIILEHLRSKAFWWSTMYQPQELLLALVARHLTDLPTLCSALCVSKHAGQALHCKTTQPTLSLAIGIPRSVYDGRSQSLQHIAQQCFWLSSHADMVARLKVCSTVLLDTSWAKSHERTARAAEDIVCAAMLLPHLKLRELHVDSTYLPATILQRIQHPRFLTRLEVCTYTCEDIGANLCTAVGRFHQLKHLRLQCVSTDYPGSLQHSVMLASFCQLAMLTSLSLSTIVPAAAYQHLPGQLQWLEISYLPPGASLGHVKALQTLRLVNPDLPSDQLVAVLEDVRSLNAVELAYSNFLKYAPVDHVETGAWANIPKLRHLDLWYSYPDHNSSWSLSFSLEWSNTLYNDIAAAIQQCTGLTSLALGFDHWELTEMCPADMLAPLTNLESLALGVGLDEPGGYVFESFGSVLVSNSRLQNLVLDVPNVSTLALQQLTAATQLTRLALSCGQVDRNVLHNISQSNVHLKRLALGGRCQIDQYTVDMLLRSCSLPHLQHIAWSPHRANHFPAVSSDISNSGPAPVTIHERLLNWGFTESDLTETSDSFLNNSASYGLTTHSDASWEEGQEDDHVGLPCGNAACKSDDRRNLDKLQKARSGVSISNCLSFRWTSPALTGTSAF